MIQQSTWKPRPGWLMLIPSKLPEKTEGGIVLPESYTTKSNVGIVIKCGQDIDKELFQGKEVIFPTHDEYRVMDTDNGQEYFIVASDHIIASRTPPPVQNTFKVSPTLEPII